MGGKAVLLGFRLKDMECKAVAQGRRWWDKVDSKWHDWDAARGPRRLSAVPKLHFVRKAPNIRPSASC